MHGWEKPRRSLKGRRLRADKHLMRWTLLALLGTALTAVGAVGLVLELAHGSDIWRRHNSGIGFLALGLYFIWIGLSEHVNGGGSGKAVWPPVVLYAVLMGIAVLLYVVTPPLAILFAIVVLPFCFGARVGGWFSGD
jgi:hypothetical protein